MTSLLIKNGTLVNADGIKAETTADILVRDGVIEKIAPGLTDAADDVIDATGRTVTAGLVDMHVHLREPGREDKETIRTATLAAAKGGITSVLGMPNTNPPIDDQSMVTFVLEKGKKEGVVRVFTTGNMTKNGAGKDMAEMWEMKNCGVKVVNDDAVKRANPKLFRKIMEYCRTHGLTIMSHIQLDEAAEEGQMHEGWVATQLGLPGTPGSYEYSQVAYMLDMLRDVRVPMHFTQVSTGRAVELIRAAKRDGLPVTCDTAPHYALLTDEACLGYDTQAKVWPPIRGEVDRAEIQRGLKDGTIDCLISDHAPHTLVEKNVPFDQAAFGITGLETVFPILYTELVARQQILTLAQLVTMMTTHPASVMGESIGRLAVGATADITVWDLTTPCTIDKKTFVSKARNTIWHGREVLATAIHTIVGGQTIVRDGTLTVA